MTDHEETIKQAKGHRRNREKVHRSNGFAMIAKKREPPFRGFRVSRRMTHAAGNGSLGNIESQHQELTVNTRCAPGWVFRHHPQNQLANLFGNSLPAHHSPSFGDRTPIKGQSLPVPTDHSLWSYDGQSLFPASPDSSR